MIGSTIHKRKTKKSTISLSLSKVSDVSFSRHTPTMKIFVMNIDQKKMPVALIGLTRGSEKD